jgi:hypothetical protein
MPWITKIVQTYIGNYEIFFVFKELCSIAISLRVSGYDI